MRRRVSAWIFNSCVYYFKTQESWLRENSSAAAETQFDDLAKLPLKAEINISGNTKVSLAGDTDETFIGFYSWEASLIVGSV